ncbi:MAG: hypothetical protein Q8L36_00065 [bacterium]|nr:hypothetical protein [bacterium]
MDKKELIRWVYLYLFTVVGLVLMVVGAVQMIDLGLKTYVFTKADRPSVYPSFPPGEFKNGEMDPVAQEKYEQQRMVAEKQDKESQRQQTAANSVALLIVGIPLFGYHWNRIQKERKHV